MSGKFPDAMDASETNFVRGRAPDDDRRHTIMNNVDKVTEYLNDTNNVSEDNSIANDGNTPDAFHILWSIKTKYNDNLVIAQWNISFCKGRYSK